MRWFRWALAVSLIALGGGAAFVYSGVFNAAADEPHSALVYRVLETTRERSIAVRASALEVPRLDDPDQMTSGGADYNDMCTECHLKPGVEDSELRAAMYPRPPDLTRIRRADPAQTFWIIKHGVKMSGMPAWGATHDDARLWAIVAFLQELPRLTPEQYQILTARELGDGDASAHEHDRAATESPDAAPQGAQGHSTGP